MAEMTIRRFGVFSVAKMYSLLMFVMGLIFGVIYGLFFILFGAAMSAMGGRDQAMGGIGSVVMGVGLMIGIPIMYGILGFIMGIIGALIYNFAAGIVGGIKFELEGASPAYAPPPPPRQWAANPYPSGS
jgi:hypothetical protein